jgi:hypothetical protein
MVENTMDRKTKASAATRQPSRPMAPKLAKNCNISCPEAKPAPTMTPTKAPAILLASLNAPMPVSLNCCVLRG